VRALHVKFNMPIVFQYAANIISVEFPNKPFHIKYILPHFLFKTLYRTK